MMMRSVQTMVMAGALLLFLIQTPVWADGAMAAGYALILTLCGVVFARAIKAKNPLLVDGYTVFAVTFLAYLLLSLLWSAIPALSMQSLVLYGFVPMMILAQSVLHQKWMEIRYFINGLVILGSVLSVYAVYQIVTETGTYIGAANYPFENPNSLAVFLGVAALCAVYGIISGTRQSLYGLTLFVILIGVVATASRAGLLGLGVVIPLFLWLNREKIKSFKMPALIVGGMAVIFALMPFVFDIFIQNASVMTTNLAFNHDAASPRLEIWRAAWMAIWETQPFIGNGLGTFYHIYGGYRAAKDATTGMHAHNDILHLWVEIGLVGLLTLLPLLYGVLKDLFKTIKMQEKSLSVSILLFIGGMALVTPIILVPALLLILAVALCDVRSADGFKSHKGRAIAANIGVVLSVCFLIVSAMNAAQDYYARSVDKAFAKGDFEAVLSHVEKLDVVSLHFNPTAPVIRAALLGAMMDNAMIDRGQRAAALEELKSYSDEAKKRNPYSSDAAYYEADYYLRIGKKEAAKKILEQALSLNPRHIRTRIRLWRLTNDLTILVNGMPYRYLRQNPIPFYQLVMAEAEDKKDFDLYQKAHDLMVYYKWLIGHHESHSLRVY